MLWQLSDGRIAQPKGNSGHGLYGRFIRSTSYPPSIFVISSMTKQKKFSVLYAFFTPALPHSLIFFMLIRAAIARKA
jgi:hypothetical protein